MVALIIDLMVDLVVNLKVALIAGAAVNLIVRRDLFF